MIVYKFGGASIKDANAIKQMANIVLDADDNLIVVVSAMGKTTNLLEEIVHLWFEGKNYQDKLQQLVDFHQNIIYNLFDRHVPDNLLGVYEDLRQKLRQKPSLDFNYEYDQIVSNGELISTKIIASYFNILNAPSHYFDIREIIKTDRNFKKADVLWNLTRRFALEKFTFKDYRIYITQGFIAAATNNQTTTLGREGSDFSGAILSNVCNAKCFVVWKDVPGIMNADPAWINDAKKIDTLSYREAIELTYFGAKVIHPKTIKPLQEKGISLIVKSFKKPDDDGSVIENADMPHVLPVFIRKQHQVLVSIRSKVLDFVSAEDVGHLFRMLTDKQIDVQLTQMSAATFTVCVDQNSEVFDDFLSELQSRYHVRYNGQAEIITIRNYDAPSLERIKKNNEVLIEQRTRRTAQIVRIEKQ